MKIKLLIRKEKSILDRINKKMNSIFKRHHLKKHFGEEEFWNNVELVSLKNPKDADLLIKLAKQWNEHSKKLSSASRGIIKKVRK